MLAIATSRARPDLTPRLKFFGGCIDEAFRRGISSAAQILSNNDDPAWPGTTLIEPSSAASLVVREGQIVTVIGPNGVGKSTLLNAIAALQSSEGQIKFLGKADRGSGNGTAGRARDMPGSGKARVVPFDDRVGQPRPEGIPSVAARH